MGIEEDKYLDFDFGTTNEDIQEIKYLVFEFKNMWKALPKKYLQMIHIPKQEESSSYSHSICILPPPFPHSTHTPLGPSPSIPSMDTIMIEEVDLLVPLAINPILELIIWIN